MNIIGINGFKRSGKGETGNAIEALLLGVHQLGFADKLKVFAARSLGYTDLSDAECIALMDDAKEAWAMDVHRYQQEDLNGLADPTRLAPGWSCRYPVKRWTVRQLLQYMGTEARTVFGEDFWVDQALPTRDECMRFGQIGPNNPSSWQDFFDHRCDKLLRGMHGEHKTLVFTDERFPNEAQRIIDLGGFNIEVVRPGVESDGHASELVLPRDLIKHTIINDGTLTDLRRKVNYALCNEGLL